MKVYKKQNVHDACLERIRYCFKHFEHVIVSVSGGKDSSVMVQLTNMVAKELNRKFYVVFNDQEAIYESTRRHIDELKKLSQIAFWWHICLPFYEDNACSVFSPQWLMWAEEEKSLWVHPKFEAEYNNVEYWGRWYSDNPDTFLFNFANWFAHEYVHSKSVCNFIGIRANESLRRYHAIRVSETSYDNKGWLRWNSDSVVNAYVMYDFKTEDIWKCVALHDFSYNEFYENAWKAGISIHRARICQPFGHEQRAGLNQYAIFEPETWIKIVNRVSGANFGNIYARTALLGHAGSMKPKHMTWQEYAVFLLESMNMQCPELTKHYIRKFKILMNYSLKHDGCDYHDWADEASNVEIAQNPNLWYNWKRVARAIERNDYNLSSCAYGLTKIDEDELITMSKTYSNLGLNHKGQKAYKRIRAIIEGSESHGE